MNEAANQGASASTVPPAVTERFYAELREIAQRIFASEPAGHTLQPTAVVNEACLRMMSSTKFPNVSRAERLALAGRVLKQVLVDHARHRAADKRGGGMVRVELHPDVQSLQHSADTLIDFDILNSALERLQSLHARQAEVVTLRVFGGLTMDQIASVLNVSKRTIEDDWAVARAWLRRELARLSGMCDV